MYSRWKLASFCSTRYSTWQSLRLSRGIDFSALTMPVQQTSRSSVWPLSEAAHVSDERGFVWQRTAATLSDWNGWTDGLGEQPPPPSASMSGRGGCDDDDGQGRAARRTERVNKLVFLFRDRMNLTCVRARFALPASLPPSRLLSCRTC